ncbi:MAG: hypothetical protein EXS31_12770 [Pedosphaera sp.]|nr:hypothetical protein [Pedosphaera sp.]
MEAAFLWRKARVHLRATLDQRKHRGIEQQDSKLDQKGLHYRNPERFKTNFFFHLGGLNLYPSLQ